MRVQVLLCFRGTVGMKDENIAWIEDASKTLEQEAIRLEFLGKELVA